MKKSAKNKPSQCYLLSMSEKINDVIPCKIIVNGTESYTTNAALLNPIIERLYRDYPRFQMVVSGGNDATSHYAYRLFSNNPEIITVVVHDEYFR